MVSEPPYSDVARGAEELARRLQGGGRDPAREGPAAGRSGQVVGPGQPGDGIEQHDHVGAQLDQALGALDGQFGDPDVILGRLVERREDDLTADRPAQVGDLFWPLADEHHHQRDLGVAVRDRVRDRLQDHRLASLRRGHDETPLALADRGDQVDDPRRRRRVPVLQAQALLGVKRGQVVEIRAALGEFGRHPVDGVDPDQRIELAAPCPIGRSRALGARRALDPVALPEPVLPDLPGRDGHVGRAAPVAGGAHEGVAIRHVHDAGHRDSGGGLFDPGRGR